MSGESPDVSKIAPPAEPPSDRPDSETKKESEEYRRKKPPPLTERLVAEHQDHLSTYRDHINHHARECERLREGIVCERDRGERLLEAEREKSECLGNECIKLRELSWAGSWMSLIGNGMVALGGIGLGVAGCWPGLSDATKYAFGGGGASSTICGLIVTMFAFLAGRRARTN